MLEICHNGTCQQIENDLNLNWIGFECRVDRGRWQHEGNYWIG